MALSAIGKSNPVLRLDSEFFQRRNLEAVTKIERQPFSTLGALVDRIQHPVEVIREYGKVGLETLMAGNIRPNRADVSALPKMDETVRAKVARNRLRLGDVLLVRTGANFGTVAPWKHTGEVYACADLLIARQPSAPAGYVSSFLSGLFGQSLVKRCSYGSAQPHIAPSYVSLIPVPRFPEIESKVDEIVSEAVVSERKAQDVLTEAEAVLLDALALQDWSPPEPLTYTVSAANVTEAARLDANYFAPKYEEAVARVVATDAGVRLSDGLSSLVSRGSQPDYSDSGLPVVNSKHVRTNRVLVGDNNRRASPGKVRIKFGDVLINGTGVGTIGRAASYQNENNALPDNHVTVVRPVRIDPLFLAIYLNSRLGQLQIERMISGSSGQIELYPADIGKIVVWNAPKQLQAEIASKVRASFKLEARSNALLETAKRAVEIAIEDGGAAALTFIAEQEDANAATA